MTNKTLFDEINDLYGKRVAKSATNDMQADLNQNSVYARIKRLTNARLAKQVNNAQRTANSSDATLFRKEMQNQPAFQSLGEILNDYQTINTQRLDADTEARNINGIMSTAINSVQYDPKQRIAWVNFVGGDKQYAYPSVSASEIKQWLRAGSKGGFYNSNIKRHSVKGFRAAPKPDGNYFTMEQ